MPYLSLPDHIAKRLRERAYRLKVAPEQLIEQWLDAEEALKEPDKILQHQRIANSLTAAEVSLAVIELSEQESADFKYVFANDAFYKFHRIPPDCPPDEIGVALFGPDSDEPAAIDALNQLRDGKEVELEYNEILLHDRVRRVELSLIPIFDKDGTVKSGVVLEYDVTRRYESEQNIIAGEKRLQAIIDSVSIGLIVTDQHANILATNQAGVEILGLTNEEFLRSSSFDRRWRVITPDGDPLPGKDHAVPEAIRTREAVFGMQMGVWRDKDQSYVWIMVDAIPHLNAAGEIDFVVCSFTDITELRQAQNELKHMNEALERRIEERSTELETAYQVLQENEQRLSAIVEMAGDCIISINESQQIIMFNKAAERTFGYTVDEVLGQPLSILMETDTSRAHGEFVQDFARSGVTSRHMANRGAVNGKRKNGEIFPAEASISQLTVKGQRIFTAILRDMTEKVLAENRLRESEERLRLLTDNATDIIALHTPDGRFVYASPASKPVLGYEPEALIHRSSYEFIHPEDVEDVQEHHMLSLSDEQTNGVIYRFMKPDSSYVWVETYTRIVRDETGEISHLVTVTRDVTERRRIEEELREERDLLSSIMQTSPSGINVVSRDGKIIFANRRSESILGLGVSDITARDYDTLAWKHTDNDGNPWPDEKQPFVQVMTTGKPVWDVEHAIEWPDGRRVYLSINGAPIFDENGEISKVVFTIEDISERRRAEQTLIKSLQKERDINRLRTRFISMASHEFKTPLAIILSSVDMLLLRRHLLTDDMIEERLKRIVEQVDQLSGLLDDVTRFDNTDTLRHRLDFVPLNIKEQIETAIIEMQAIYRQAPEIIYRHELPNPELSIDAQLFKHILINLLSNAIKYSGESEAIEVVTRVSGLYFELIVQDKGIGIPEKDQSTLFEFFQRGSNVGNIKGTGVGLAVVKQAVELQGGTIEFHSQVNAGTTFIVRLPLDRPASL